MRLKKGIITHISANLPDKKTSLMDIANEIPIKNKEAEKIIKTTGFSHIRKVINETTKRSLS